MIPIYKSGDKLSVKNYRPVSLLCTCSKLMEHIVFKHLSSFLETNDFFSSAQHGFRRGLSTVTQLIHTTDELMELLDKGEQIDMIFLDFEKAFDRVSHSNLLVKVRSLIHNDQITNWIEAYLSQRHQYVQIGNSPSYQASVISGVPQGSVLGPLLFLIYLNDLHFNSPVHCRFFADDCIAYLRIQTPSDQLVLNDFLALINDWGALWHMKLNISKCTQMTVTRKKNPLVHTYKINKAAPKAVTEIKNLGIHITSTLNWSNHTKHIVSKASRKLWLLKRRLQHCTSETKLLAYTSLIRPLLEYADTVWDPHTTIDKKAIEGVQRRAIRFIYNAYGRHVSVSNLIERNGIPTLETRRKIHRLQMLYNIINNRIKMNFNSYMQFNRSRPTRGKHDKTVVMPRTRTDAYRFSFFPRTIAEWNALPPEIVNMPTIDSFLTALKNHLA